MSFSSGSQNHKATGETRGTETLDTKIPKEKHAKKVRTIWIQVYPRNAA